MTAQIYSKVLQDISEHGPASDHDIAKLLGKSWLHAHSLLEQMTADGLLLPWLVSRNLVLYGAIDAE